MPRALFNHHRFHFQIVMLIFRDYFHHKYLVGIRLRCVFFKFFKREISHLVVERTDYHIIRISQEPDIMIHETADAIITFFDDGNIFQIEQVSCAVMKNSGYGIKIPVDHFIDIPCAKAIDPERSQYLDGSVPRRYFKWRPFPNISYTSFSGSRSSFPLYTQLRAVVSKKYTLPPAPFLSRMVISGLLAWFTKTG